MLPRELVQLFGAVGVVAASSDDAEMFCWLTRFLDYGYLGFSETRDRLRHQPPRLPTTGSKGQGTLDRWKEEQRTKESVGAQDSVAGGGNTKFAGSQGGSEAQ